MEKRNDFSVYFSSSVAEKLTEAQILTMANNTEANRGFAVSVRRDDLGGLSLDFREGRSRKPIEKLPLDISVKV